MKVRFSAACASNRLNVSENEHTCVPTRQVNDLRKELDCRALSSKGLKSQLIARLTKQLKVEEQVEESKEPDKPESKIPEEEEPSRTEEEREVSSFISLYWLTFRWKDQGQR